MGPNRPATGTILWSARCFSMNDPHNHEPPTYRAEDVRQGQIILKRPWQRWLFGIGLAGGAICAVLLAVFGTNP